MTMVFGLYAMMALEDAFLTWRIGRLSGWNWSTNGTGVTRLTTCQSQDALSRRDHRANNGFSFHRSVFLLCLHFLFQNREEDGDAKKAIFSVSSFLSFSSFTLPVHSLRGA